MKTERFIIRVPKIWLDILREKSIEVTKATNDIYTAQDLARAAIRQKYNLPIVETKGNKKQ